jgi:hypothetical protein
MTTDCSVTNQSCRSFFVLLVLALNFGFEDFFFLRLRFGLLLVFCVPFQTIVVSTARFSSTHHIVICDMCFDVVKKR